MKLNPTQQISLTTEEVVHHHEHYSKLSTQINTSMNPKAGFFVQLSANLCMKIQLKYTHHNFIVSGQLVRINGFPLTLPHRYISIFMETVNGQENDGSFFYYSLEKEIVKYKYKLMMKSSSSVSTETIQYVSSKLTKLLPKINLGLRKVGITTNHRSSTYIKAAQLQLKKRIASILLKKAKLNPNFEEIERLKGQILKKSQILKESQMRDEEERKGGYFKVMRRMFTVMENEKMMVKELAVKKLKDCREGSKQCLKQISRQMKIISNIKYPTHFLNYYQSPNKGEILMDYAQTSLQNIIFHPEVHMAERLDLAEQICQAISDLHDSGVVHRDLKVENIMVMEKDGKNCIKLIDFCESALTSEVFNNSSEQFLGATLPFSPIECSKLCSKGFNKKEIDYWSLCVVLYEIFYIRQPLHNFKMRLPEENEFVVLPALKQKRGMKLIEEVISWITIHGVCMNQSERIRPQTVREAIKKMRQFEGRISDCK